MLDLTISNKPNGGIPVGRITELNGLELSGKSLRTHTTRDPTKGGAPAT